MYLVLGLTKRQQQGGALRFFSPPKQAALRCKILLNAGAEKEREVGPLGA